MKQVYSSLLSIFTIGITFFFLIYLMFVCVCKTRRSIEEFPYTCLFCWSQVFIKSYVALRVTRRARFPSVLSYIFTFAWWLCRISFVSFQSSFYSALKFKPAIFCYIYLHDKIIARILCNSYTHNNSNTHIRLFL